MSSGLYYRGSGETTVYKQPKEGANALLAVRLLYIYLERVPMTRRLSDRHRHISLVCAGEDGICHPLAGVGPHS
jgi:hypothetical protein